MSVRKVCDGPEKQNETKGETKKKRDQSKHMTYDLDTSPTSENLISNHQPESIGNITQ